MGKPNTSPLPESRIHSLLRICRPLIWWFILVLLLFGIRTHQQLLRETRLRFSVKLGQNAYPDASVTLDGKPVLSGQLVSLGRHYLAISHPKADSFYTNRFIWYGGHDFGTLDLKRAKGTIALTVKPAARWVSMRGPEFTTLLTNTTGGNFEVPTDRYQIEGRFAFAGQSESATVFPNTTSTVRIAPKLGATRVTSSHSNTTFSLVGQANDVRLNGEMPAMIQQLPESEYLLTAERKGVRRNRTFWVLADKTNEVAVEFEYGAAILESDPSGATVLTAAGARLGLTPMILQELQPGAPRFVLTLEGYEIVVVNLQITVNQTNHFSTNLVNHLYTEALAASQRYFADGDYARASESAGQALEHKEGDPIAQSLQHEAIGLNHLAKGRGAGQRGDFVAAMTELNASLESIPGNAEAKQLLAEYTLKQDEVVKQEARRRAEKQAAEARLARISLVQTSLENLGSSHSGSDSFAAHQLFITNGVTEAGEAIQRALTSVPPAFKLSRYEWVEPDRFIIDGEQMVDDGFRYCVIVGGQVATNETVICFKVIERQTPHSVSLLGGLVQAQVTTESDRNGQRVAKFQEQIKLGEPMVEARIRKAVEVLSTN
jgi:hypothetical protein